MKVRLSLVRMLSVLWLVIGCMSGCVGPSELAMETGALFTATATSQALETPVSTTISPFITSTVISTPEGDLQPTSTPQPPNRSVSRPPSGWTIYSNPDYVQGIAIHGDHLWAATLGGVVDWDINSRAPVVYTTRDGLVEIQANDIVICQMPQERVLVSHETGTLSAYDLELRKWARIPITFDDGSTLSGVSALFCDSKNDRLLVGSANGLGIFDMKTGRWRRVGAEQGLNVDIIKAIDVVGQSIWIAAGKQSAFMIQGNTIYPFNGSSGFPSGSVNDLSVGPDFSIWLGYPTGLIQYKDKLWNSYGNQVSTGIPFVSVDEVEIGRDNSIWIASANEGICPFDLTTRFCSTIYPAPRDASITDLAVGENGMAFAATNGNGVLVLESDRRTNLLLDRQKLISNDVLDIAESQDGKLWVATDQGINFFDLNHAMGSWQLIRPERNGLLQARVTGLQPSSDSMWFVYDHEGGVSLLDNGKWTHLSAREGLYGQVSDMAIDQRGYVWFTTNLGIEIWDGVTMRSYGQDTGLPGNLYNALLERDGTMWIGMDRGLLKYEQFQWTVVLPDIAVNAIAPDDGESLLLGTDHGLVLFDGKQSFQWVINLGEEVFMNTKVTSLSRDHRGNLWVGTQEYGLFYYNGEIWDHFDTSRGMPTNTIRKIFTDHLGGVWIAATTGKGGGALVRFMP